MKPILRLFSPVTRWMARRRSSETVVVVLLSMLVGLSSAAGVWLFKQLILLFQKAAFGWVAGALAPLGQWTVILPTVAGGLLVGWIVRHWVGHERLHGVAGIMESVAVSGGRLAYTRTPAKALAAALSIGVGASVGPEDPSVQIGANLGSMIGQSLHLTDDRVRSLVAAGAAGGISAAFNAPIAAVFFALEIVLGELSGGALSVVVLSSVISAVFTQAVSGREPAFHVPPFSFNSAWELPLYLLLGLACGVTAALYERALTGARDVFQRMAVAEWVKPAIGGLILGISGLFAPQILGVGYETIANIFSGASFSIGLLLLLLALKLILTPLSLGSGFQGGVFAPSLYLGAALGAAFGQAAARLLPGLHIVPAAFAMVGMAAVLAGAVRAPLTAILLLFEMTDNYAVILPLMFAVIISMLVSERLQHESVYTLQLLRQGIRLEHGRDVEVLEVVKVGEVMTTEFTRLSTQDTLQRAEERFAETHSHGFPVVNERGELAGIFTISGLEKARAQAADPGTRTVGEFCNRDVIVAHPDEPLSAALRRMSVNNIGRLPVVEAGDPLHMVGFLRRADVIKAYDVALTRRLTHRHTLAQARLNTFSRLPVFEERIQPGSAMEGKLVGEIHWPGDIIIAAVRRSGQALVPHGSTRLQAGDALIFIAESGASSQAMLQMCKQAENGLDQDA